MSSLVSFSALEKALARATEEHPRRSEPAPAPDTNELSQLIARIAATPEPELPQLAARLSDREAVILVHAFELDLDEELNDALHVVLTHRPVPRQLSQGWIVYRNHPTRQALTNVLRGIAERIPDEALRGDSVLQRLRTIWRDGDPPEALVADLASSGHGMDAWLKDSWPGDLTVDTAAPLGLAMPGFILAHASRPVLLRHGLVEIAAWFDGIWPSLVRPASINYLNKLGSGEWSWPLVESWVERYGLPRGGHEFWDEVYPEKCDVIQRHIAGRLIEEFFMTAKDPEGRFRFWKSYVDDLVDIAYPPNKQRVMLRFNNVIVVEFKDIGNAGYIYGDQHASRVERLVVSNRHHAACKVKDIVRHRILHQANWQPRAREVLDQMIRGKRWRR